MTWALKLEYGIAPFSLDAGLCLVSACKIWNALPSISEIGKLDAERDSGMHTIMGGKPKRFRDGTRLSGLLVEVRGDVNILMNENSSNEWKAKSGWKQMGWVGESFHNCPLKCFLCSIYFLIQAFILKQAIQLKTIHLFFILPCTQI